VPRLGLDVLLQDLIPAAWRETRMQLIARRVHAEHCRRRLPDSTRSVQGALHPGIVPDAGWHTARYV
jgi:hypothetical protein